MRLKRWCIEVVEVCGGVLADSTQAECGRPMGPRCTRRRVQPTPWNGHSTIGYFTQANKKCVKIKTFSPPRGPQALAQPHSLPRTGRKNAISLSRTRRLWSIARAYSNQFQISSNAPRIGSPSANLRRVHFKTNRSSAGHKFQNRRIAPGAAFGKGACPKLHQTISVGSQKRTHLA